MKEKKTADFVGSIIGNIIAIAIVNTALFWRQWTRGVVLETWVNILWAANLSLLVQIFGNLLLAFYRPPRFYALMRALFAAAGLLSVIVFYIVFPLDFSLLVGEWLNTLVRVLLFVSMGATLITASVFLVRFLVGGHGTEDTAA